jgi:hypothetical protein
MCQRLLYVALCVPLYCVACPDLVTTHVRPGVFPSELAAVRALAATVLADSVAGDIEFAGGLYHLRDGGIRVSVGRGCPGADTIRFAVPLLDGAAPVAYWHTHGRDGFARERFSPDDARLVLNTRCPFYLITPRGQIHVLDLPTVRAYPAQAGVTPLDMRYLVGFAGRRVRPRG